MTLAPELSAGPTRRLRRFVEMLREANPVAAGEQLFEPRARSRTYSAASPAMMRRWLSCIGPAPLAWSGIYIQSSCMPVVSRASLTTRPRFSLRCTCSIGTPATKSGHCDGHHRHRGSSQPGCRFVTGASPRIGRKTTTGVLQHSRRNNSVWQTSTRVNLSSKRSARMRKRGNVSPRFSGRTACE